MSKDSAPVPGEADRVAPIAEPVKDPGWGLGGAVPAPPKRHVAEDLSSAQNDGDDDDPPYIFDDGSDPEEDAT